MVVSFGTGVFLISAPIVTFFGYLTMQEGFEREKNEEIERVKRSYQREIDALKQENSRLKGRVESLDATLKGSSHQASRLNESIRFWQSEYRKLQNSSTLDGERYSEVKKQKKELKKENNQLYTLTKNQGRLIKELRKEFEMNRYGELKEENKQLRQRIEDLLTVNKEQAIALSQKEKRRRKERLKEFQQENEYEPTNSDLEYISRHLDILLINREEDMTHLEYM